MSYGKTVGYATNIYPSDNMHSQLYTDVLFEMQSVSATSATINFKKLTVRGIQHGVMQMWERLSMYASCMENSKSTKLIIEKKETNILSLLQICARSLNLHVHKFKCILITKVCVQ